VFSCGNFTFEAREIYAKVHHINLIARMLHCDMPHRRRFLDIGISSSNAYLIQVFMISSNGGLCDEN